MNLGAVWWLRGEVSKVTGTGEGGEQGWWGGTWGLNSTGPEHFPGPCELSGFECPSTSPSCPAAASLLAQGFFRYRGWSWPFGLLQFPQDYQWVLCPFLFAFLSEIYSKQQREMPEGNFSILGKIKICAKIHAYIHVDTCVTETHFLCYLWSIYSNHSKIQLMHNTEKSPVELGRKHETLFCAGKFCSIYYPLFSPSTSSMKPLANPRRLWPALGINICL